MCCLFPILAMLSAPGPVIEPDSVRRIQVEPPGNPYDWGPCVMRDGDIYRMWWVRLAGDQTVKRDYTGALEDGAPHTFTYPCYGDRICYLESGDGIHWDFDAAKVVLEPAESANEIHHLARPAVVKVDGMFHMYYESCGEYQFHQDASGAITGATEYHNQVFLASSRDGVHWQKHGGNADPRPVVAAPAWNKEPGKRRYGLGQPSAYYRDGRFVLHYVDSCTGPGDFMVRLEADNPEFRDAVACPMRLEPDSGEAPKGAVARFSQTQVRPMGEAEYLIRPAYGTGRLGLLRSVDQRFAADTNVYHPKDVYPQLACPDPRGEDHQERLYPTFLTDPHGAILVEDGKVVVFYSSGAGFKEAWGTWDLFRCEVGVGKLRAGFEE